MLVSHQSHQVLRSKSPRPRGGQLRHDHGQQRVRGVDPNLHGALHQRLAGECLFITYQNAGVLPTWMVTFGWDLFVDVGDIHLGSLRIVCLLWMIWMIFWMFG